MRFVLAMFPFLKLYFIEGYLLHLLGKSPKLECYEKVGIDDRVCDHGGQPRES